MPTAASTQSSTGRPPAGVISSRRTDATSRLASTATSQSGIRMAIAVVDHGRNSAMATTSQSAVSPLRNRSMKPVKDRSRMSSVIGALSARALTMGNAPGPVKRHRRNGESRRRGANARTAALRSFRHRRIRPAGDADPASDGERAPWRRGRCGVHRGRAGRRAGERRPRHEHGRLSRARRAPTPSSTCRSPTRTPAWPCASASCARGSSR